MADQTIDVTIDVTGVDPDTNQQRILSLVESNIETLLRKDIDYGSSYANTAKVESVLKHGEVRPDELPAIVARQVFVRGFMDKVSRFYTLAFESDEQLVGDESLYDTLLDLSNYAILLVAELQRLQEQHSQQ